MTFSHEPYPEATLSISGYEVERVNSFKYLGATLPANWNLEKKFNKQKQQEQLSFKMNFLFCNNNLNLKLRQRILQCYNVVSVWSVLLYVSEVRILKVETICHIQTSEMWLYRTMFHIPWTTKKSNDEVLRRTKVGQELHNS